MELFLTALTADGERARTWVRVRARADRVHTNEVSACCERILVNGAKMFAVRFVIYLTTLFQDTSVPA